MAWGVAAASSARSPAKEQERATDVMAHGTRHSHLLGNSLPRVRSRSLYWIRSLSVYDIGGHRTGWYPELGTHCPFPFAWLYRSFSLFQKCGIQRHFILARWTARGSGRQSLSYKVSTILEADMECGTRLPPTPPSQFHRQLHGRLRVRHSATSASEALDTRCSAEPLEAIDSSRDSQWLSASTSVNSATLAQFTTSGLRADRHYGLRSRRCVLPPGASLSWRLTLLHGQGGRSSSCQQ